MKYAILIVAVVLSFSTVKAQKPNGYKINIPTVLIADANGTLRDMPSRTEASIDINYGNKIKNLTDSISFKNAKEKIEFYFKYYHLRKGVKYTIYQKNELFQSIKLARNGSFKYLELENGAVHFDMEYFATENRYEFQIKDNLERTYKYSVVDKEGTVEYYIKERDRH